MSTKLCRCGSGLVRRELVDAAGIFCDFVCDRCEQRIRSHYNPNIFKPDSPYAITGEEADIEQSS